MGLLRVSAGRDFRPKLTTHLTNRRQLDPGGTAHDRCVPTPVSNGFVATGHGHARGRAPSAASEPDDSNLRRMSDLPDGGFPWLIQPLAGPFGLLVVAAMILLSFR